MSAITHWNSPKFLGYFGITGSNPGIYAAMLEAALTQNAMRWHTSPVASELAQVTLDWLKQLLGLPAEWFGMYNETSEQGLLSALVTARELSLEGPNLGNRKPADFTPLRVYCSTEAHMSVERAARVVGVGVQTVRTDDAFRMSPQALEQAIEHDLASGITPIFVAATVGTTSSTSIDDVSAIASICKRYGLWLHVDAAYAAPAALLPEYRWILHGCEHADSFVFNPHKWLFAPIGCSVVFFRWPEQVRKAFSLVPEYLKTPSAALEETKSVNYMDYGLNLTQRFHALTTWFILRSYGTKQLQALIREHIRLAALLASWIDEADDFEVLAPRTLSVVCFRAHPRGWQDEAQLDAVNERLLQEINAAGFFLTHTRLRGRFTIRVAIGNEGTGEQHIRDLWTLLREKLHAISYTSANNPAIEIKNA